MEENQKDYYIGLDLGTSSIGWAVVDEKNQLIKKKGKNLWGVRLFDEAQLAEERRTFRRQRRTINKRKWRLFFLKEELKSFVEKEDNHFFENLKKSYAKPDNRKYFLFNDKKYTDKDYFKEFPTIYHLRKDLQDENKVKSYKKRNLYYRFLYLALSDILKRRGHFLSDTLSETELEIDKKEIEKEFNEMLEEYNIELDNFKIIDYFEEAKPEKSLSKDEQAFENAILGKKFNLKTAGFFEEKLECNFSDENWEDDKPEDALLILNRLYKIYCVIFVHQYLKGEKSISMVKVKEYETYKSDFREFKNIIKENAEKNQAKILLKVLKDKNNKILFESEVSKEITKLFGMSKATSIKELFLAINTSEEIKEKIEKNIFLEKPNTSKNSRLPYQLHYVEANKILNHFVSLEQDDLNDTKERILKVLKFKVPYFVGPLSNKNNNQNFWLVKKEGKEDEKITPFNFDSIVDKQKTAQNFIERMEKKCTYLQNYNCTCKDTILYQEYVFYNTVNKIKNLATDEFVNKEQKQKLYNTLLTGKLTKKKVKDVLDCKDGEEISGFSKESNELNISLSAVERFYDIFPEFKNEKTDINESLYKELFDDVINSLCYIDQNEKSLRKEKACEILKNYKHINLNSEKQEEIISKLIEIPNSKKGNLSREFLKLKLVSNHDNSKDDSVLKPIINILKESNMNLMELLYIEDNQEILAFKNEKNTEDFDTNLNEYLKDIYIPSMARRTIIQTYALVKEIVKIMGYKPKNIAIEFTREKQESKETDSRFTLVKKIYNEIKKDKNLSSDIKKQIENIDFTDDGVKVKDISCERNKFKIKKIYLYFLQLGKDIYTGKEIDFSKIIKDDRSCDIDHIVPKSKLYIDSFDNTVLINTNFNQKVKRDKYPIDKKITNKMITFWKFLLSKKLMSSKKYERLIQDHELTSEQINDFINRQKTTLDWINLATAKILNKKFNEKATINEKSDFIIYSKSKHVSLFRNIDFNKQEEEKTKGKTESNKEQYKFLKIRELNNFHHAHDAYLNVVIGRVIKNELVSNKTRNLEKIIKNNIISKKINNELSLLEYMKKIFEYKDIFLTKKPKINFTGQFWDDNIVKAKDELFNIKKDMPCEKYGGYNKVSTAFFSILFNKKENKLEFFPVPIYWCNKFFDKNRFNEERFREHLLKEKEGYEIKIPLIPINQKFLVDGIELRIAGKTKKQIIYHNCFELLLNNKNRKYVKEICNFFNKTKKLKQEERKEEVKYYESFTKEKNEKVFLEIIKNCKGKVKENIYERIENRDLFKELDLFQQLEMLFSIFTKLLKGSASNQGEIYKINDEGKINKIKYNDPIFSSVVKKKNKSNYKLSMIKESITGFYNKKIDINV